MGELGNNIWKYLISKFLEGKRRRKEEEEEEKKTMTPDMKLIETGWWVPEQLEGGSWVYQIKNIIHMWDI